MPGIGPRGFESLNRLGLRTLGALAAAPIETLENAFGSSARSLQQRAKGISNSEVVTERDPKSISRETTFSKDISDWKRLGRILKALAEHTTNTLRRSEMRTACVTLKIRYAGFETHTHSLSFDPPTALDHDVFEVLDGLLAKAKLRRRPVRLIGVGLSKLSRDRRQLLLFEDEHAIRWTQVLSSVDQIRKQHGFQIIGTAATLDGKTYHTPERHTQTRN